MTNNNSPVLDPDTIAELQRAKVDYGNPLLIRQLVGIYQTNAPKRIEQIRGAIAGGDAKTLGLVAHTLKTNCAMLGATAMAAICATLEKRVEKAALEQDGEKAALEQWGNEGGSGGADIEQRGEKAAFDDAAALFAQIEAEFERVLAALAQLLEGEPI